MPTGNYTWEEVLYGIDTRAEAIDKERQRKEIQEKQAAEADAASKWSLGLSLLGAAIPGLGPIGYFLGQQIGKYGADFGWFGGDYSDWEDMRIEEGRFNTQEVRDFNESIAKAAKDQEQGQLVGSLIDLGKMYVMSGGLTEGFDFGLADLTTFGAGEGEWSVWGRGTAPVPAGEPISWSDYADPYVSPAIPASEDYLPPFWESLSGKTTLQTYFQNFTGGAND